MGNLPKISCLCVSNNRVDQLKNAVKCFEAQTYKNKELLILHLSSDTNTARYADTISNPEISVRSIDDSILPTLGDLRNLSISASKGEYVCNWDDDDWYHKDRLAIQYQEMISNNKRACVLSNIIIYDKTNRRAYLSHRRTWENSLLCEKAFLTEFSIRYPPLSKGEDTVFLNSIRKALEPSALYHLVKPQLYVYCFTGNNTCDAGHFAEIFKWSEKLSDFHSSNMQEILTTDMDVNQACAFLESENFLHGLPKGAAQNEVSIDRASSESEPIIKNLLELNRYDLSSHLLLDIQDSGLFGYENVHQYWGNSNDRVALLIRYRNRVVGFSLLMNTAGGVGTQRSTEVVEFFILRRYRQLGIGRWAIRMLWDLFKGRWDVRVLEQNKGAIQFLRNTMSEYSNGAYSEMERSIELDQWHVFSFLNET